MFKQAIKSIKDFCKKHYQQYRKNKEQKQKEKAQRQKEQDFLKTIASTVTLLNIWLIYLSKMKEFKLYRGSQPDVHVQKQKFYILFNSNLSPTKAEKDYTYLCQNCWIDFLNLLYEELSKHQEELAEVKQQYERKYLQYHDNLLLLTELQKDLQLEPDHQMQTRYRRQIRDLTAENRRLYQEEQDLSKKISQLENTCSKLEETVKLTQKGRKPVSGYFNNQSDNKLFILKLI